MADKPNIDQLFNLRAAFPTDAEQKAFFEAAENNDTKTLKKTLEKWPEAAKKWRKAGDPVIVEHYQSMTSETIRFLTAHGADIDAFNDEGSWSPMLSAAFASDLTSVEKLLRAGAAPDLADRYHRTPLSHAAEKGNYAMADLLVVCGADHARARDWTKNEEMLKVIDAAAVRRAAFVTALDQQLSSAPATPGAVTIETPADDSAIQIMKRIEFKKKGLPLPAEAPSGTAGPKNWMKKLLRR